MAADNLIWKVEEFLAANDVDLDAAEELRLCEAGVQRAVLASGPLGAGGRWSPSEVLMWRISQATGRHYTARPPGRPAAAPRQPTAAWREEAPPAPAAQEEEFVEEEDLPGLDPLEDRAWQYQPGHTASDPVAESQWQDLPSSDPARADGAWEEEGAWDELGGRWQPGAGNFRPAEAPLRGASAKARGAPAAARAPVASVRAPAAGALALSPRDIYAAHAARVRPSGSVAPVRPAPTVVVAPVAPAAPPPAAAPSATPGPPRLAHWIALGDSSSLVQSGLPTVGLCVVHEKGMAVFSSASNILTDVLPDFATSAVFTHDPNWKNFPEVAEAVGKATGEDCIFTVATCPGKGKWGVGVAGGWKFQDRAAKLALSIALVHGTPKFDQLCGTLPEFRQFCFLTGLLKDGGPARPVPNSYKRSLAQVEQPPKAKGGASREASMAAAAYAGRPQQGRFPQVHWLAVDPSSRIPQEGLPEEGPAVAHDKAYGDCFGSAGHILAALVGDVETEVAIHDDPDWEEFAEVGEACRAAGVEENCLAVATAATAVKWGVGLAGKWKDRESAAKLALCVAVAKAAEPEKLGEVAAQFPDFAAACSAAGGLAPLPARISSAYKRMRAVNGAGAAGAAGSAAGR